MAGLEPLVMFWTGWGIHFMVVVSFTVQVALLLASDFRRRKDWAVLKVVIWSAYMLADTTAIYALGHLSVVCRSAEHHLMALWAPLLLVHLGGQDSISAYAIEDNRLWLRHLQTLVLQVAAAAYVLYVSSILSHPMSSKLSWAAILMFVVGVLKYGERIWALKRANSCASSSLSVTSYDKVTASAGDQSSDLVRVSTTSWLNRHLIIAYSLLDVPKKMFEGPTSYVQISNNNEVRQGARDMLSVVEVQLSMMYDLLYTKAAVVHTWYGLCSRVISLPFTVAALALYRSLMNDKDAAAAGYYKRADVTITNVLLTGAVVLEIMSVLRAIFSKWTAVLLYGKEWATVGDVIFLIECMVTEGMEALVGSDSYWSGRMRQHFLFGLTFRTDRNIGRKMATKMGVEDWWDSKVYSWSTEVPELAIIKVLELVSNNNIQEIRTTSLGLNALRSNMKNKENLVDLIWTRMMEELKLEERILVWHITTHVYIQWHGVRLMDTFRVRQAAEVLANYMFFLLAARPYMLPYPVSRQVYLQLCSDITTHFPRYCNASRLLKAILNQKEALMNGTPLQPDDEGIGRRKSGGRHPSSINSTLDRGCQLAAKLIHITMGEREELMMLRGEIRVDSTDQDKDITEQATSSVTGTAVLNMLLEVWAEMLCHTAYLCNEKSHAKHLTDGGEIMTIVALLMIYMKNGLIQENTSGGTAAAPSSSQGAGATDIDTEKDAVV